MIILAASLDGLEFFKNLDILIQSLSIFSASDFSDIVSVTLNHRAVICLVSSLLSAFCNKIKFSKFKHYFVPFLICKYRYNYLA